MHFGVTVCKSTDSGAGLSRQPGFTVIELVVVIFVIGIISAVMLSRSLRSDTYNAAIARDQIISMARTAQQKAIGRNDVGMTLQSTGDNLNINISDSTGVIQSVRFSRSSVDAQADVNVLSSCSVLPAGATVTDMAPFVLRYTHLGDLLEGGVGGVTAVTTGARVCINNDPSMSVCISSAGYAYEGDCVE